MRARRATAPEPQTAPGKLALTAVTRLAPLTRPLGADPRQVCVLVGVWLALDERRGKPRSDDDAAPASPLSGGLVLTLLMNLLIGLVASAALFLDQPAFGFGLAQGVALLLAVLVLVTDYSAVFLDDTDIALIAPLPVADRTFVVARLLHVGAYLALVVGSLTLPGLIVGCFALSPLPFVAAWIVASIGTALVALGLSFGVFLVAARLLAPERFADLLVWIQVLVTVVVFGGMQIAPRVIDFEDLGRLHEIAPWMAWVLPSCHGGGLYAVFSGQVGAPDVALAALAIALPSISLAALVWLGQRGLLQSLSSRAVTARGDARRFDAPRRRADPLPPLERAGYDWFAAVSGRERLYKLRTWSQTAIALLVGLSLAFTRGEMDTPELACVALYFLGAYSVLFMLQARESTHWEARWLFEAAPITDAGPLVAGAWRALAFRRLLPIYALVAAAVVAVGGIAALDDALFATGMVGLLTAAFAAVFFRAIPFAARPSKQGTSGSLGLMLLAMFVSSVLGGVHVLLHNLAPLGIQIGAAGLPVLAWSALRAVRARRVPLRFR